MGLALIAIFTAALLLPGVVATKGFYNAGETAEVELSAPSYSTADGILSLGVFSLTVHIAYIALLSIVAKIPPCFDLPLANPYIVFQIPGNQRPIEIAWQFFSGLGLLTAVAYPIGWIAGSAVVEHGNRATFYGPMAEVISASVGDARFITAYVVSKIGSEARLLGYEGVVESLSRDSEGYPSKVVLVEVEPFFLAIDGSLPMRTPMGDTIDRLILTAENWHNIAFRVYSLEQSDLQDTMEPQSG